MSSREASDLDALPDGVEVVPLAEALASGHPLLAQISPVAPARDNAVYQLNAAFMTDGVVIRVAPGAAVETPVHLRFVTPGRHAVATATRVLVVVEDGGVRDAARESHEGPDGVAHQPNDVVEIVAGDRAKVRHVRLNAEGRRGARAVDADGAARRATCRSTASTSSTGAAVSRHQVFLDFAGEHSTAHVNGATMIKAASTPTPTLVVDHAVPHCDEPRAVQDRHRRRGDRRVPGQDHRQRRMRRRRTAA